MNRPTSTRNTPVAPGSTFVTMTKQHRTRVDDVLARISCGKAAFGTFQRVRHDEAIAEAATLTDRSDLAELALAGVPIAVTDVTAVAGECPAWGSRTRSPHPFGSDSEVVERLRAAGAVIVGLTRAPELCLWPMTDTSDAVGRNLWVLAYTPGGSSGGSAAAAAGLFRWRTVPTRSVRSAPPQPSAGWLAPHRAAEPSARPFPRTGRACRPRARLRQRFRTRLRCCRARRAARTCPALPCPGSAHRHLCATAERRSGMPEEFGAAVA
jgi:hypothetical protein